MTTLMTSGADAANTNRALQSATVKRLFRIDRVVGQSASKTVKVTLDVTPWKPVFFLLTRNANSSTNWASIYCNETDNIISKSGEFISVISNQNNVTFPGMNMLIPTQSKITLNIGYMLPNGTFSVYQ